MLERIENSLFKVEIDLLGGALTSIYDKKNNQEFIYQKEEGSWQGQDVVIFPFVARLKNKIYSYKGKEYSLKNHGLCRYSLFEVVEKHDDSITLKFSSNPEILEKEYPFPFSIYVKYEIISSSLNVQYIVNNEGDEMMPFGIGAHPAFIIDGYDEEDKDDTSNNFINLFNKKHLTRICFDEKGEVVIGEEDYGEIDKIEIKKDLFRKYQTLCLTGDDLSSLALERRNGSKIYFHYSNIQYFVLWSFLNNGRFVAIEPWMSLPDFDDAPTDIDKKKSLIHLDGHQSYTFSYSVKI